MGNAYTCNVVIDLEFTPVPKMRRRGSGLHFEIIEVGAVKLAADGSAAGEFSHVVRPTYAKEVSGAVHHMTGICNEDLTCARSLADVLESLITWIGPGCARMVTWSDSDLRQIRRECDAKNIKVELPSRWLDIQRLYPRLMGMKNRRGKVALGEAADWLGIPNERMSAHRALYDAQMTADIFRMMASGGCAEHRSRVSAELESARTRTGCSASIAEQCDGLADLLETLRSREVA